MPIPRLHSAHQHGRVTPRNASLDAVELAACTAIAGLILNLDEAIMKQ